MDREALLLQAKMARLLAAEVTNPLTKAELLKAAEDYENRAREAKEKE